MKIYTKKGDSGQTSLIGGTRVPKHHIRVEAYGCVDALNVATGMLADQEIDPGIRDFLRDIQKTLFVIGADLAADPEHSRMALPALQEKETKLLESRIDSMESELSVLRNFILPGGHPIVSVCQFARVSCRTAERRVSALAEIASVAPDIQSYLNRLSDYFFVLGRFLAKKLGVPEIPWHAEG